MSGKFALIIGNTEYADPKLSKLTAPGKDAETFAQLLRAPDLASFDDVTTLINQSSYDARRAIAQFLVNRKPDDLLLLYFSGHGVRDEQGRLYLATKDADNLILDATAIPAEFITHAMDNCRSKRQVLILDCCNSGAFAYGTKAATGASMGTASAFEGNGYGRIVLTATDATQFAYEGDRVMGDRTSNSLFTHFLIKGLEGEADTDGDGRITVDELYDYASEQIHNLTPNQKPEKFVYHQQEKLILTTKVRPQTIKPVPLEPELEAAIQSSVNYVRKAGVEELGSILNGINRRQALTAEQVLKKIAESDDSLTIREIARGILNDFQSRRAISPACEADKDSSNGRQHITQPERAARESEPEQHEEMVSPIVARLPREESRPETRAAETEFAESRIRRGAAAQPRLRLAIGIAAGLIVIATTVALAIIIDRLGKGTPGSLAPSTTVAWTPGATGLGGTAVTNGVPGSAGLATEVTPPTGEVTPPTQVIIPTPVELQKTSFSLPDEGAQGGRGPFCCTGRTATVSTTGGSPIGYVYFYAFPGGAYNISDGSVAANLSILISGITDLTNINSPSQESSIDFAAGEMQAGASKSGAAGALNYTVTITNVDLQTLNGQPFYNMQTIAVVVNVALAH